MKVPTGRDALRFRIFSLETACFDALEFLKSRHRSSDPYRALSFSRSAFVSESV